MTQAPQLNGIAGIIHPENASARQGVLLGEVAIVALAGFGIYQIKQLKRLNQKLRIILAGALPAIPIYLVDRWADNARLEFGTQQKVFFDARATIHMTKRLVDQEDPLVSTANDALDQDRKVITAVVQRNRVYVYQSLVLLKPTKFDRHWINELAAYEMGSLLGFASVMPKISRYETVVDGQPVHAVQVFQPDCRTITELYMDFANAFDGEQPFDHLLTPLVSGFDLESLQKATLVAMVLGSRDAHNSNNLTDGEGRVWAIDHEEIMPLSNAGDERTIPVLVAGRGVEPRVIRDCAPIRCAPIGLPQATLPFTATVIRETLASLDGEKLQEYHRAHNLYDPRAVSAQLERVALIRQRFEGQDLENPTLSPRTLFTELVGHHSTFKAMQAMRLKPFFLFQMVGFVPSNFQSMSASMVVRGIVGNQIAWKNDGNQGEAPVPSLLVDRDAFPAAITYIQVVTMLQAQNALAAKLSTHALLG